MDPAEPNPQGDEPTTARARTPRLRRTGVKLRFFVGIVAVFAVMAGAGALLLATAPSLAGYDPVVITSGSMRPHVRPGDVVLFDTTGARPSLGRIIRFHDPVRASTVVHRIVGFGDDDRSIITKGDANPAADSTPVGTDDVAGSAVMLVPFVGTPRNWFVDGEWGRLAALVALLLVTARCTRFALRAEYDPWAIAAPEPA